MVNLFHFDPPDYILSLPTNYRDNCIRKNFFFLYMTSINNALLNDFQKQIINGKMKQLLLLLLFCIFCYYLTVDNYKTRKYYKWLRTLYILTHTQLLLGKIYTNEKFSFLFLEQYCISLSISLSLSLSISLKIKFLLSIELSHFFLKQSMEL